MTALDHAAATAFIGALKSEARGQPDRPVFYDIARGLRLRVTYRPPRRKGRIDLRDVRVPELLYAWELWARKWYDAAMPYVDEDAKGWTGIDEAKALAFLEGRTVEEYEASEQAAREDVFARIARGT